MQHVISALVMMFSVLVPQKVWFAPDQALTVNIQPDSHVQTLTLTDFAGKQLGQVPAAASFDVKQLFPMVGGAGTYVLYAGTPTDFAGTPLVIEARTDKRQGAPPGVMVYKIEPLRYAVMTTDAGPITSVFYYDVAPNTVDNFLSLSEGGYYDGLTFHRIVPGFVIQGGDPRGDGTGGPGYDIPAEFNDHPHHEGVLSMARSESPDSAGSQFFICLDYAQTQQLDGKYTAYGIVTDGMDAVKKIAAANVPDSNTGKPDKPQVIQKVQVIPVTKDQDPYSKLFTQAK